MEQQQDRLQLFDTWAEHYDHFTQTHDGFPFDGYEQVLDDVIKSAAVKPRMTILDLGIGTGNLAARFAELDCDVWGLDFSSRMLEKVKKKLPNVTLVQADLLGDWSAVLDGRFDRIVSSYVLHEFPLPTKVRLLQKLANNHLVEGGRIVIGDIAFPTRRVWEQARQHWADSWDEDEFYWDADEAFEACEKSGLQANYRQVSTCAGVFIIEQI